MKIRNLLIIAGVMVISAISVKSAVAAVVDFTGPYVNMAPDPLVIGQTGTITGAEIIGTTVLNVINGTLPSSSMITFSYSFDGTIGLGGAALLSSTAGYSYANGGQSFDGFAAGLDSIPSFPGTGFSVAEGTTNGLASTALAFASAEITAAQTGTTVIKNLSAGTLDFVSTFLGTIFGSPSFTIAYEVSSVPIPAALPMFALSLAALAGYRRRKSKKSEEAVVAA